jgi:hypothetical protein
VFAERKHQVKKKSRETVSLRSTTDVVDKTIDMLHNTHPIFDFKLISSNFLHGLTLLKWQNFG